MAVRVEARRCLIAAPGITLCWFSPCSCVLVACVYNKSASTLRWRGGARRGTQPRLSFTLGTRYLTPPPPPFPRPTRTRINSCNEIPSGTRNDGIPRSGGGRGCRPVVEAMRPMEGEGIRQPRVSMAVVSQRSRELVQDKMTYLNGGRRVGLVTAVRGREYAAGGSQRPQAHLTCGLRIPFEQQPRKMDKSRKILWRGRLVVGARTRLAACLRVRFAC